MTRRRQPKRSAGLFLCLLAVLAGACSSEEASPSDFVYRARIDDCRLVTPQLATAFRIDDRILISAGHPYEEIRSFVLNDSAGEEVEAEVLAIDPQSDLAILRLVVPSDLPAIPLADEEIPFDRSVLLPTYNNDGDLSVENAHALRRAWVTMDGDNRRRSIELEAEIRAGDSGAPVLFEGEAVGAIFATARGKETGWAVSLPEILSLLEETPRDSPAILLACTEPEPRVLEDPGPDLREG